MGGCVVITIIFLLALAAHTESRNLSRLPPWKLRANEIVTALKQDPSLKIKVSQINDPDSPTRVLITVRVPSCKDCWRKEKAEALATMLAPYGNVLFGTASVFTIVRFGGETIEPKDLPNNGDAVFDLAQKALKGNKMFVKGLVLSGLPKMWYLLFKAQAMQYYTDDLSQWMSQTTELACDLLSRVYGITSARAGDGMLRGTNELCPSTGCP